MSKLRLSLACGRYEIMRGLWEGAVEPDGIDLAVLSRDRDRIFSLERRNEVDIAEFNVMEFFRLKELGEPVTGLPIYPHRRFRHGFIFINTSKGIERPADLIGKRLGLGISRREGSEGYTTGAVTIWARGILNEHLGVPYDSVTVVERGFGPAGPSPRSGASQSYTVPAERDNFTNLLLAGEVDSIITPGNPRPFLEGDPRIARLLPNHTELERAYYAETGIFPIMHIMTIRSEILDRHPWVASSMANAFEESKNLVYERMHDPRMMPLVFFQDSIEDQVKSFGKDPWEYGLGPANLKNLTTAARYATEQGMVSKMPDIKDIVLDIDPGPAFAGGRSPS